MTFILWATTGRTGRRMMSRIGTELPPASPLFVKEGGTGGVKGFSMIEVMIATVVLLLGTVMIHESFLRTADLFGRYLHTLKVRSWMDEQMWSAREAIVYSKTPAVDSRNGAFDISGSIQIASAGTCKLDDRSSQRQTQ